MTSAAELRVTPAVKPKLRFLSLYIVDFKLNNHSYFNSLLQFSGGRITANEKREKVNQKATGRGGNTLLATFQAPYIYPQI